MFRTLAVSGRASGACISSCMLEGPLQESGLRDEADAKASAEAEAYEMRMADWGWYHAWHSVSSFRRSAG